MNKDVDTSDIIYIMTNLIYYKVIYCVVNDVQSTRL